MCCSTARICTVVACALWALGCGGAPFSTDDPSVADGGGASSEADTDSGSRALDQRTVSPEGAQGAPDAAPTPESGATVDARVDAVGAADAAGEAGDASNGCADDLSNVHTGDFHIGFDVLAMAGDGVPLLGQRSDCGQYTAQWDVTELSSGNIDTYFYDGAGGADLQSVTSVNDGVWHHVAVARVLATLSIAIDGRLDNSIGGATWSFGSLPLLQVGRSICNTPFTGQIKNICVTKE